MKALSFAFLLFSISGYCQQQNTIVFETPAHDFGTIKELDGPVEFDFKFRNNGLAPIKIINVKASCGCTTPAWTKDEVLPGAQGFIKASYNPINRPGPFHKTLTVTTSGTNSSPIILRISGNVTPKPRTVEDDLPTQIGAIRIKYRAFNMGKVYSNASVTKEFEVYNSSDSTLLFLDKIKAAPYISVSFEPKELAAKSRGIISVSYDGSKRNDLGFMSDQLIFYTNEPTEDSSKVVSVYADVQEYFAPLTEKEKAKAPKLSIERSIYDFGTIKAGEKVSTTFTLENTGKKLLNIRKTKASCGCTVAKLVSNDIKPGKKVTMQVSFNSVGRRGNQIKTVTLYSNDPVNPIQKVTIKAKIASPSN